MNELQKQLNEDWADASVLYNDIIRAELDSFRAEAWTRHIHALVDAPAPLTVLDCGCGPGFFTTILARAGHRVCGIDGSPEMLAFAAARLEEENLQADLREMDCHRLAFDDDTFDLVLSRNLTHALQDHEQVYREWLRVLKPGGVLLIFDANWHLARKGMPEHEEFVRRYRETLLTFGSDFSGHEYDGTEASLDPDHDGYDDGHSREEELWAVGLKDARRPDWDLPVLERAGFVDVTVDRDITGPLWDDKEKLLYGNTPLFQIRALKPLSKTGAGV